MATSKKSTDRLKMKGITEANSHVMFTRGIERHTGLHGTTTENLMW